MLKSCRETNFKHTSSILQHQTHKFTTQLCSTLFALFVCLTWSVVNFKKAILLDLYTSLYIILKGRVYLVIIYNNDLRVDMSWKFKAQATLVLPSKILPTHMLGMLFAVETFPHGLFQSPALPSHYSRHMAWKSVSRHLSCSLFQSLALLLVFLPWDFSKPLGVFQSLACLFD